MKVVITGSSGLVGTALTRSLASDGYQIIRLLRGRPAADRSAPVWDPLAGELDPAVLSGADVVINLNGRNIGDRRWSGAVKAVLRTSRIEPTRTLATALASAARPPSLLINASATGYYGDRGEQLLTEESPPGSGFLADVCRDWEAAARDASSPRTRVVLLRLGMVVAAGGALDRMLLPFKLGAGGPIGGGSQYWPWVALDDVVGAVHHVIASEDLVGPVNVVSPEETRCRDFTSALGRVLHRPAVLSTPAFAARLALGEMAEALLLASARVAPRVLADTGYRFATPCVEDAIRSALAPIDER